MKLSISRVASIICGVLSAIGIAYVGLSQTKNYIPSDVKATLAKGYQLRLLAQLDYR